MSEGIVEIRDYTIEAESFEAYRDWAERLAGPWLRANLDVIDFWVECGIEPEVSGSSPEVPAHGLPNVCWIIRWESIEDRARRWNTIMGSAGWREVWAEHPCPDAYLQRSIRFFRAA